MARRQSLPLAQHLHQTALRFEFNSKLGEGEISNIGFFTLPLLFTPFSENQFWQQGSASTAFDPFSKSLLPVFQTLLHSPKQLKAAYAYNRPDRVYLRELHQKA
jgi:hypothetical protein